MVSLCVMGWWLVLLENSSAVVVGGGVVAVAVTWGWTPKIEVFVLKYRIPNPS